MTLSAAFAGASAAFLISAVLISSDGIAMELLKLSYSFGLIDPQLSFAGSFPNPLNIGIGKFLFGLGGLCLCMAGLSFFLTRKKPI